MPDVNFLPNIRKQFQSPVTAFISTPLRQIQSTTAIFISIFGPFRVPLSIRIDNALSRTRAGRTMHGNRLSACHFT